MGWAAVESPLARTQGGLLGRDEDIVMVARELEFSRLVTLAGAPGIGKTRLAVAVSEDNDEPSAVVQLASVEDAALVPAAVAAALSVPESPGQSLTESVVAALRRRRLLLVLDNCEHVLGACARIANELLAGCSELRVLAASQEPLGLDTERVWQVSPLRLPEEGEVEVERVMGTPSVALFVERAAEAQPGFVLSAYLSADVATICRRLEGIPLAIELAAARVGTLTPAEIAARLEDRLTLLSAGSPSPLPRHQTLAAALDWSHALLEAPERVLLRRLSVFVGTFELEAAEQVCAGVDLETDEIASVLRRLVSKSLLVADGGISAPSPVRYRLLDTIKAYAAARLDEAGEVAVQRAAHASFYLSVAERAEPELVGPHQLQWLQRLEVERANLRAAIEWSLSHGRTTLALRLAGALVLFWRARGHFSEGREMLQAVISASEEAVSELGATALWGAGFLTLMAGDPGGSFGPLEQSLAWFRELADGQGCARALLVLANARQYENSPLVDELLAESAELAREVGDSWCLAHALGVAGFECATRDELQRARQLFEECVDVARSAGDVQGLRYGLIGLGGVRVDQGDYAEARSLLEEAVEVTHALGEDYDRATALTHLGALALGRGDYGRARELLEESLGLIPDAAPPDAWFVSRLLLGKVALAEGEWDRARDVLDLISAGARNASVLVTLGRLALLNGHTGDARGLFEEALELSRETGHRRNLARAIEGLGQLARSEGDLARAAELHHEALELHRQMGLLPEVAGSFEALAGLAAAVGQLRGAARLFGAADALRSRGGFARLPWEAAVYQADFDLVRRSLAPEELVALLDHGRALSLGQAVAEADTSLRRPRPATGWHSLTKREAQIADLVAEGQTNPEIAESLVISVTTVKTHVKHVFSKLGVTGRRELARTVHSRHGAARSSATEASRR